MLMWAFLVIANSIATTDMAKHVADRNFLNKTLERKATWDAWMAEDMANDSKPY